MDLSDAIALPVLLEAVMTAGGLAQVLQPDTAARLQRARALAAMAAQGDPGSGSGLGRADPAWPDMSDRALLAWPVGPLAAEGHLAGVRSRAQLQHIDWDAVLR